MAEIYETLISFSMEALKLVQEELDRETPQALHSMLQNKQNKEEAIEKFHSRMKKKPLSVLQSVLVSGKCPCWSCLFGEGHNIKNGHKD